jgi:hypothetical protein
MMGYLHKDKTIMKLSVLPIAALSIFATVASASAQNAPAVTPAPAPAVGLPGAGIGAGLGATNFVFLVPLIAAPLAIGAIASGGGSTNSTTSTTD